MVALRGIGYQSRLPRRKLDALLSELAAQTEHWVGAGLSAPANEISEPLGLS